MAVVLMAQKFKAISVMQLYFLETRQNSFLCQRLYQEDETLFSWAPFWNQTSYLTRPKARQIYWRVEKQTTRAAALKHRMRASQALSHVAKDAFWMVGH